MTKGRRLLVAACIAIAGLGSLLALKLPEHATAAAQKPNVIFILTDDQTLAEMSAMPQTAALIGGRGATFDRAYISYPLCCPSRATLLTGQYMHNTGVRGNNPPFGGWDRFAGLGDEAKALPVWMKDAGYYTVQMGKYLNGYGSINPTVPAGWDEWYGKLSQYNKASFGNQIYFNYSLLEQGPGGPPAKLVNYGQNEGDYQTDVLLGKAIDAIHRLGGPGGAGKPFFLDLWLSAPHAPYVSSARFTGAFAGAPVPTNASINERNMSDKPRFMQRIHPLKKRQLQTIGLRQRNRWAQLLSVDQGVSQIVEALRQVGQLDNTYIVFSSDNGYFSGEHRIAQGKYLPFEPSSHVPLLVRGPGIPAGSHSNELVSNADIAPTIAQIGGAAPELTDDGRSLLPYAENPGLRSTRPLLLEGDTGSNLTGGDAIEASAKASGALAHKAGVRNLEQEPIASIAHKVQAPPYRAIRTDRYLYVQYAGHGGVDLYDMSLDPLQLRSKRLDRRYALVRPWLAAKLLALQSCIGASCSAEIGPEPTPSTGPVGKLSPKSKAKSRKRGGTGR